MAKKRFMEELSVEGLIEEFNFFVPEIQREYVWGHNEREILDLFFQDLMEGKQSIAEQQDVTKEIALLSASGGLTKDKLQELTEKMGASKPMNIGFLYSYQPDYRMEQFPNSDSYKDAYLIDGQQRFTTLFLTLYYLSVKEDRRHDFIDLFRFDEQSDTVAFDYRVRNLTHNFVIQLIKHVDTIERFNTISSSTWFLSDYANDPTVSSIIKAIDKISEYFGSENAGYFDYLKSNVMFWHFKTEKTDQGEELYITMNSRGKQLEDNETLRAKFFETLEPNDELFWSAKWEEWQDFFWRNRDKKDKESSADRGFNEFLRCIAGLESFKGEAGEFLKLKEPIHSHLLMKHLTLDRIERYFKSLEFLFSNRSVFAEQYEYSNWLEDCFHFIQVDLLSSRTNWFIDPSERTGVDKEKRMMVFFWSTLTYLVESDLSNEKIDDVFRVLRIYWVRYNNHDRGVQGIRGRLDVIKEHVWSTELCTPDERHKHNFLASRKEQVDLRKLEGAIWLIEDHPLNLNGYQVKAQNISHLVDFSAEPDVHRLLDINRRFRLLFPDDSRVGSKELNSILLFYGYYWTRITPYYYENLDFSNWRRIIRDIDSGGETPEEGDWAFAAFFITYDGEKLNGVLKKLQREFLIEFKEQILRSKNVIELDDIYHCFCLYSMVIKDMWQHGRYLAIHDPKEEERLCLFEERRIYNTRGHFRGNTYDELWEMACRENGDNPVQKIKQLAKQV